MTPPVLLSFKLEDGVVGKTYFRFDYNQKKKNILQLDELNKYYRNPKSLKGN